MRLTTDLTPPAAMRTTLRDWLLGCAIGLALLVIGGLWADPHDEPVRTDPLLSASECDPVAQARWPAALPVKVSGPRGSACMRMAADALRP